MEIRKLCKLSLFLLIATVLNAQGNQEREKFDIKKFNENKVEKKYIFTLQDGTNVKQFGGEFDGDTYVEQRTKLNSPFKTYKSYYSNGILKVSGQEFYTFEYGTWSEYDIQGNLIKQTNYDEPFNFSIEDLIQKIKKENGIDITKIENPKTMQVSRHTNLMPPYYQILIPENNKPYNIFMINGITGELMKYMDKDGNQIEVNPKDGGQNKKPWSIFD